MRVLHVINSLQIGGAESLLRDLAQRLQSQGIIVSIALLDSTNSPLEKELSELRFDLIKGTNGIYCPKNIYFLGSLLNKYDLVHTHLFPTQLWVAIGKRLFCSKTPLITTEHSTYNRRRKFWFRPLDKWMYHQYKEIVCISKATEYALNDWLPGLEKKLRVVPNGIDIERFKNACKADKGEWTADPQTKIILTVGRLEPQKGYHTLLHAMTKVQGAYLILAGDGIMREELEKLARDLRINTKVFFLGRRNDIPELIKMADVYVQPSNWEGFGIAALEAMAGGLPVIASNVPGLIDLIGNSGIVFQAGDSEALASSLNALLSSPEERNHYSVAAMKRAEEFSIDQTAENLLEIYQRVVCTD